VLNFLNFEFIYFLNLNKKVEKSNKSKKLIYIIAILALLLISFFLFKSSKGKDQVQTIDTTKSSSNSNKIDSGFYKALFEDTSHSHKTTDSVSGLSEDDTAGSDKTTIPLNAKRINIAIIGTDGRFGVKGGHADANHILSIAYELGKAEIISIPRDTYVDCGYPDSTGLNKLTVYYLARGKEAYLKQVEEITNLQSIPYYIEFGFSQAMGILKFLGFNSSETLQLLRSRKSFAIGDYQRVYNQAQFIKQMIFKNYDLLNSPLKPIILKGILSLVNTNLTYDKISSILDQLNKTKFKESSDNITIKIRPSLKVNFKVFDFSDPNNIDKLRARLNLDAIAKEDTTAFQPKDFQGYISHKLDVIISSAEQDTLKNPTRVISKLSNIYEQKTWLQISNDQKSLEYSKKIANLLINAYSRKNNRTKAREIKDAYKSEEDLFNSKKK
jgi:anionic cell wall polymer biosynthesis LytR-Cps2A-Psr (LCP) family protein